MKDISHSKPTLYQEDISTVVEVLNSGQLADSAQVALFEKELSAYIGHEGGLAANSGTNALYLALLSLGHNNKDEVIIPSYVCIALLNAIYHAKLKPRIVDINEHDYNISLKEIEKAINNRSKTIIVPHMFGDPIENIEDIVNLGLPVIEDCALSVGASVNDKKIGSFSALSVFSFYVTKVFTTGHGGMILSSSAEMLNTLKDYMRYDNRKEYHRSFNFRLTDFQAALGRSQLSRLDDFIAKRREIAGRYNNCFRNINGLKVPSRAEGSIYYRYIIENI
jgi:perosamine synthetase